MSLSKIHILLTLWFCAWDMNSSFRFSGHPSTGWVLDKMCHVQWATISNIQACLFQGDVDDCSCTGKQSTDIDWWQCRATTNNGVQMVLERHRFAQCLSCSPWTWIFVSIAEMVAVPCVSISLCEHIRWCITFWQTTFQKAALRHVVSHPLWVCWLTQLSTQICNVQIFGEAVYYFST